MPEPRFKPIQLLTRLAIIAVVGAAGLFGYQLLRADLAAQVYRDRLEGLATEYEQLRGQFNEVVAKTAVTELLVKDNNVTVRIASATGTVETIETPFTADGELHVDYVVIDGRLLIRRLYDESTAPNEAMVIDPALAEIDWDAPGTRFGTTIYRTVDEGRWVISISANGALDLSRAGEADIIELANEPPVREYDEIHAETKAEIGDIGPGEVFRRLFFGPPTNDAAPPQGSAQP
ncbi:MAG: hypothetical protein AAFN41_09945 [Planctomycetota bacterium]